MHIADRLREKTTVRAPVNGQYRPHAAPRSRVGSTPRTAGPAWPGV